jgi:hypothetical protein
MYKSDLDSGTSARMQIIVCSVYDSMHTQLNLKLCTTSELLILCYRHA